MLKSTYRRPAPAAEDPLPPGWTEHQAPTGHTYYYHAESQSSTYTRPTVPSSEPLRIDFGATEPDHVVRASMQAMDEFYKINPAGVPPGRFTGGRAYQEHARKRGNQGDRPKLKAPIPNCEPWLLVKTKLGRRFVHNTETKQSLWKFPEHVMMAVIEMDRLAWEAEQEPADSRPQDGQVAAKPHVDTDEMQVYDPASQQQAHHTPRAEPDDDSDSYEEVEVTDDEADDEVPAGSLERPRAPHAAQEALAPNGPVEFNEDDMAFMLAEMEEDEAFDDEGLDPDDRLDDEDQGLPLTVDDKVALFRSLLDDSGVSPYATFEKFIEDLAVVEDARYVALPNTASRKDVFASWSKDRIAEQQALKEASRSTEKRPSDVRVEYLRFLQSHATPKLYWPEFKRKFRKEPQMRDGAMPDRDREKLYREFVAKLKCSESDRRKELVTLLKGLDKSTLTKGMTMDELPSTLLKDSRFWVMGQGLRNELVQTFLETL